MALVKKYFTASGSWVAPSGVTSVIIVGAGGGGGGAPGNNGGTTYWGGGGGGGSIEVIGYVTVVPNTTYTITIGAGGTNSVNGSDTTFGSLYTCKGAACGVGASYGSCGGFSVNAPASYWYLRLSPNLYPGAFMAGCGGCNYNAATMTPFVSSPNIVGFSGGTTGANSGSYYGGGGGGGGPMGAGANGGAGNSGGAGTAGSSAAANSGGGGGGGGGGTSSGTGGTGGSGYIYVIFSDG